MPTYVLVCALNTTQPVAPCGTPPAEERAHKAADGLRLLADPTRLRPSRPHSRHDPYVPTPADPAVPRSRTQ